MSRDNKVAIVTGVSRGTGAAIAARLAADGFTIVLNYADHAEHPGALVAKLEANGARVIAAEADVSDPSAVAHLFCAAEEAFGGIDVIVNNAAILELARIAECSDALFERQIAVNLKAPFNVLRQAAIRVREGGRIISMSSSVVGLSLPGYGVYTATKAALEALTRVLASELRGRNVTVNAVAPGPTATALFLDGKSPALIDRLMKMSPLERLGEPAEIANVVAFLAGPDGAWVNGQVLRANGGMV